MPVRRVVANDLVAADRQRVALQRGPIVFAAEWPDNPGGKVRNLVLPDDSPLRTEFRPDLLGGVQVITAQGVGPVARRQRARSTRREQDGHRHPLRDVGQPRTRPDDRLAGAHARRGEAGARSRPSPARRTVTTSDGAQVRRASINDGEVPASSDDATGVLRLVAEAGHVRVGRAGVQAARDASRTSRSTGSTTRATARCACPRRGGCSTRTATRGRRSSRHGAVRRRARIASTP